MLSILLMKETPEPFPLPAEVSLVKAAAGWAHCVAVTGILDFSTSFDHEIDLLNIICLEADQASQLVD